MRIVEIIPDDKLKITVFDWQDRYLVQCEDRDVIITYKYKKSEIPLDEVKQKFDPSFIDKIKDCIVELHQANSLSESSNTDHGIEEII